MNNPLLQELNQRLPGVTLSLPTGGLYYPEGTLSKTADPSNLTVHAFSVWQEVGFRDPYRIAAGTAMRDMVRQVCPEFLAPDVLAAIDADAIMVAARLASYGPEMELSIKCTNPATKVELDSKKVENTVPLCGMTSTVNVDLNKVAQQYIFIGGPDEHQVLLPNGQRVQVQPVPYMTTMDLMKTLLRQQRQLKVTGDNEADEAEFRRLIDESVDASMKVVHDSVGWVATSKGVKIGDREAIRQWFNRLPVEWAGQVTDAADKMADKVKDAGTIRFECPECKHAQERISIVQDPNRFFGRSSRRPGTQRTSPGSLMSRGAKR